MSGDLMRTYYLPSMWNYSNFMNQYSALQMPYLGGFGYSPFGMPSFMGLGSTPGASAAGGGAGAQTTQTPAEIREQKKEEINKELKELYAKRAELADIVIVNTPNGAQQVSRSAFSEETGYIAEDGDNDGKISAWSKIKNLGKGIANLVTDMFCDENGRPSLKKTLTSLAIGGVLGAAALIIPGAGLALAGFALASGAITLGVGAVQAGMAETDESAEKAWQNIGSGTAQTILSLIGLKQIGASSAAKLGVKAPKIWRPDQSIKLGIRSARAEVSAAGGMSKAIGQNYNNLKVSLDKNVTSRIFNKTYYERKYENNLNKLKTDIPGAGPEYRQYADDIAAAYERVYGAQSKAEYTQAVDELYFLTRGAKAYRANNSGLSPEAAQAFDDMIRLSESVAPKNAYAIRASKFKMSDFSGKIADLDAKISRLKALGNAATPEQKFELQILSKLKTAHKRLYQANTPKRQKLALKWFNQIKEEVFRQMHSARNNPNTSAETMKAYNDLAVMIQEQAAGAGTIVKARSVDLNRAAKILGDDCATAADKARARAFIERYSGSKINDEAYISSVDGVINNLKLKETNRSGWTIWNNWKSSKLKGAKNMASGTVGVLANPAVLSTTTIDRMVYPQSVLATYGERLYNTQVDEALKQVNDRIEQLRSEYNAIA